MPELPNKFSGWKGFSEFQNQEMSHALDLLGLLQKSDGNRRSVTGLNRIGQNRWPDRGWRIEDTEQIADAWKIAGMSGLAGLVAVGKANHPWGNTYGSFRQEVKQLLSINVPPPQSAEVFVSESLIIKRSQETTFPWAVYLVRAETDCGLYSFYMANHQPPETWEAERFCIYHNQVPRQAVIENRDKDDVEP